MPTVADAPDAMTGPRPRLSVIMPFYRKLRELQLVLPYNARWIGRPDVELVLVLDEPSCEAEVIELVRRLPMVRARVLVNDQPHDWRGPSEAVNVGLRAAEGDLIMMFAPECLLAGDGVSRAVQLLGERPGDVVLGRVAWSTIAMAKRHNIERLFDREYSQKVYPGYTNTYYGCIAASRELLMRVGGWQEGLTGWGAEDDNIRSRLSMAGALLMLDRRLRVLHVSERYRTSSSPSAPVASLEERRRLVYPKSWRANPEGWGQAFDRVAHDWRAVEAATPAPVRLDGPEALAGAMAEPSEAPRLFWGSTGRTRSDTPPTVAALLPLGADAAAAASLVESLWPVAGVWIGVEAGRRDRIDLLEQRRRLLRQAEALGAQWILAANPGERFDAGLARRIGHLTNQDKQDRWTFRVRPMAAPDAFRVDGDWGGREVGRLMRLRGDAVIGTERQGRRWSARLETAPSGLDLFDFNTLGGAGAQPGLDPEMAWPAETFGPFDAPERVLQPVPALAGSA